MISALLERFGIQTSAAATSTPRVRAPHFPNVVLTSHRGQALRFYTDVLRGKTVVIGLMYTRCAGICPATVVGMRQLQEALGPRAGRDISLYSVTLDPEYDAADVLGRYAKTIEAGPGWSFLTGSPSDIELVRRRLGFVDPDPVVDRDKSRHSGMLLCGSEPYDRWAASPAAAPTRRILKLLSRVSGQEVGDDGLPGYFSSP
jgi:protein SCO1/2